MRKTAAFLNSQGVRVGLAVSDPGTLSLSRLQCTRGALIACVVQATCATCGGRRERR
jgi:hypothetical protein